MLRWNKYLPDRRIIKYDRYEKNITIYYAYAGIIDDDTTDGLSPICWRR